MMACEIFTMMENANISFTKKTQNTPKKELKLARERMLARISHQNDKPSLDLCFHKKFYSLGKTARIPLGQKITCENKSLRDHLAL